MWLTGVCPGGAARPPAGPVVAGPSRSAVGAVCSWRHPQAARWSGHGLLGAALTAPARLAASSWQHCCQPGACSLQKLTGSETLNPQPSTLNPEPSTLNPPRPQVYLASASPPVRYPSVYGVDMPSRKEFVASNLTESEICQVA